MDIKTAQNRSLDLMSQSEAVFLTTIDPEGWPNTRAMLNFRNHGKYPDLVPFSESPGRDMNLYFTTNTSSGKVAQIVVNRKASSYFCIPSEWRGLMVGGEISVVIDIEIKNKLWQNEWTMYYPGGPEDPDYAILSMTPRYLDSCTWNPHSL